MMKRAIAAVALATIAMTLVGCGSDDDKAADAPAKVAVAAGVNDAKDPNIAALTFLPATVTVKAGSTVEWWFTGPEPHTVTFLPAGQTPPTPDKPENAALRAKTTEGSYSGTETLGTTILPTSAQPAKYDVKFPTAGDFTYFCIIHPGMQGTVKVVADGDVDTQKDINKRAAEEKTKWIAEGTAAKKKLIETPIASTKNADGSTAWTFEMGTNTQHTAVLAFQPAEGKVKAGDTVTFINNSGDPHTASFKGAGSLPANPESPEAMAPSPGASPQTLDATGVFNTGWLPPNAPPGAGPPAAVRSFTFKIPTAGTYQYVCLLHEPSGMGGSIVAS